MGRLAIVPGGWHGPAWSSCTPGAMARHAIARKGGKPHATRTRHHWTHRVLAPPTDMGLCHGGRSRQRRQPLDRQRLIHGREDATMRNRLKSLLVVAYAVLLVGSAACVVGGEKDDEGAGSTPV